MFFTKIETWHWALFTYIYLLNGKLTALPAAHLLSQIVRVPSSSLTLQIT